MRNLWGPPKSAKGAAFIEAYRALDATFKAWGYRPKSGQTYAYSPRRITGGSGYSLHAYGPGIVFRFWTGVEVTTAVAVDINSIANPYGHTLRTDMARAMIEAIEAIRTKGGARVWRWGGDWNDNEVRDDSNYDAMHFELQASPAELRQGIDWRTVRGDAAPITPEADPYQEEEVRPIILKAPNGPLWLVVSTGSGLVRFLMSDGADAGLPPNGYGPVVEVAVEDLDKVPVARNAA